MSGNHGDFRQEEIGLFSRNVDKKERFSISVDEIHQIQGARIEKVENIYATILERCYRQIKKKVDLKTDNLVYPIPKKIIGIREYNMKHAIVYVMYYLKTANYVTRFVYPNNILIIWEIRRPHILEEYRRATDSKFLKIQNGGQQTAALNYIPLNIDQQNLTEKPQNIQSHGRSGWQQWNHERNLQNDNCVDVTNVRPSPYQGNISHVIDSKEFQADPKYSYLSEIPTMVDEHTGSNRSERSSGRRSERRSERSSRSRSERSRKHKSKHKESIPISDDFTYF